MRDHKKIIEDIEAWPNSPGVERNTLDALTALYRLLDERLPEKPMQVIQTPTAPAVSDTAELEMRKTCAAGVGNDSVGVYKNDIWSAVGIRITEADEDSFVVLTPKDARELARTIIAIADAIDKDG